MFFFNRYKVDYERLIATLETSDEQVIHKLLWQPKQETIDYLPFTSEMLQKLKKPPGSTSSLSIFKIIRRGKFELIILNLPWEKGDKAYSPIIIDRRNEKIVGIMLPFNELYGHMPDTTRETISSLGILWVQFIFEKKLQ